MKFTKLTKKLLLSALSLGLAVVTLTTTTFAWYTSSTEAQAGNGSAGTSGQTSDSSLMISSDYGIVEDKKTAHWGPTAVIDSSYSVSNLVPLQYDGEFKPLGEEASAVTSGYYEFKLWFKTTGASTSVDVFLKDITITNTSTVKEYPTLLSGDIPAGCPVTSYYVDVVQALDLVVESDGSAAAYNLSGYMESYKQTTGFDGETPDAIDYYNAVMPTDLTGSDNINTPLDHANIGAIDAPVDGVDQVLEVTFTIFLNGWDAYCFDVCRGQSFSVSLDFTTKAKGQA